MTSTPAAFDTIKTHLEDLGTEPEDYDCILTGDLGSLGLQALTALLESRGIRPGDRLRDCGCMIFDPKRQDVHCGGSGCGCSAAVLCAEILPKLESGQWKRVLFCGTGALLSPTSTQQKLPIPGICHAVCIESEGGQR